MTASIPTTSASQTAPPLAAAPAVPTPLVVPSQPVAPVQRSVVVLPPGEWTTIQYVGPTQPVPEALASINGAYDAVYLTQPISRGTPVYPWAPGQPNPPVLEYGSMVTIHVKPGVPATLTYTVVPPPQPVP